MLLVTLRNLAARKVRLLMSAFAIMLGVAFVAGSLVFTDTMSKVFTNIVNGTVSDVNVRSSTSTTLNSNGLPDTNVKPTPIPAETLQKIRDLPGAASADGQVQGFSLFVRKPNGKLLGGTQGLATAFNWSNRVNMAGDPVFSIVKGHAPKANDEFLLDSDSAQKAGYKVGDNIELVNSSDPPIVKGKLVGLVDLNAGGLAGATVIVTSTPEAQALFLGGQNAYTGVSVQAKQGVSQQELAAQVSKLLPPGTEAITGTKIAEQSASLIGKLLGFVSAFLLIFAGIALVVGTFIILNTFSILVAQRSRELAMLRALGASKRQVTLSVIAEAVVVGLVGSTAGLLAGFGLAWLLTFLLSRFGLDISGAGLVFRPMTIVISYVLGMLVTLIAALMPARRAASIPPVAAMRDDIAMPETSIKRRMIAAGIFAAWGLLLMVSGVFFGTPQPAIQVGIGVFAVLMAVAMAAPVLSRPVLAVAGRAYQAFGMIGLLATQNARRNPRRTAATASALMIGMALVTTMSILGSSMNKSIDIGVDEQFKADYVITSIGGQPFSANVDEAISSTNGVGDVAQVQNVTGRIDDKSYSVSAIDSDGLSNVVRQPFSSGAAPAAEDEVALSQTAAKDLQAALKNELTLNIDGKWANVKVVGIYPDSYLLGNIVASPALLQSLDQPKKDSELVVNVAKGSDKAAVGKAMEKATTAYPTITVQSKTAFAESQRGQVATLLGLIYALLGLAIVIAVLGIINTLSLSVVERTREMGLLRAVGLTRPQLRQVIRLESVAISILGALLGIISGLLFGVALQRVFVNQGIEHLSVPFLQLILFLVLSGMLGIIAAIIPAWRASKLNVLAAIATAE